MMEIADTIKITAAQHRNLLRLRNYFKRVTWACIDQTCGVMNSGEPDPSNPCCFGAHFVGCFRKEILSDMSLTGLSPKMTVIRARTVKDRPNFRWTEPYFYRFTGISHVRLTECGASEYAFGCESWEVHPRTVLERLIRRVKVIET